MENEEDASYVCRLSDYSLKKAMKELNEDPKQRLGAVQVLRKWIQEQKHYNCPQDTRFLLDHLRKAKFSQLGARQLIDNYMNARTTHPDYITNLDLQDPSVLAYVEEGIFFVLPKPDKEGRTILVFRLGMINVKDPRFDTLKEVKAIFALMAMIQELDENSSVNGISILLDCTKLEMKYINDSTLDQKRIKAKILQDCSAVRLKAFHFYNTGAMMEVLMMIVKAVVKKKLQERFILHDTMESLYKVIPMELLPTDYLPDDYDGPSAGSIDNIVAGLKNKMMNSELRNRILAKTSDKYKTDLTKRPRDVAPQESFRKLNIDY